MKRPTLLFTIILFSSTQISLAEIGKKDKQTITSVGKNKKVKSLTVSCKSSTNKADSIKFYKIEFDKQGNITYSDLYHKEYYNLLSEKKGNSIISMLYDSKNKIKDEKEKLTEHFDKKGRRTQLILQTSLSEYIDTIDYTYDKRGNLTYVAYRNKNSSSTLIYDKRNRIAERLDINTFSYQTDDKYTHNWLYRYDDKDRIIEQNLFHNNKLYERAEVRYNNIKNLHPINKIFLSSTHLNRSVIIAYHSMWGILYYTHSNITFGSPEAYEYIATGEEKERIIYNKDGKEIYKQTFDFQFNEYGIWTKQFTSIYFKNNEKIDFELTQEVEYY